MSEIKLEFESRFIMRIILGAKRVTFRRGAKANIGDTFPVEYCGEKYLFRITDVQPMCLSVFCDNYFDEDGFKSPYDAREYFARHYGDPHDFCVTEGFLHRFERV